MQDRTPGAQARRRGIARLVAGITLLASLSPPPLGASDVRRLADGTRVQVKLLGLISSESSTADDAVPLEVARSVTIDGAVVIRRGTRVSATIVDAAPATLRRRGRLAIATGHTRTSDGMPIPLRPALAAQDERLMVFPRAMRRNLLVWVAEGTMLDVFVDGDHVVAVTAPEPEPPSEPPVMPEPPLQRPAELTNDDVLTLVAGDVSDDVIVTLIQASRTSFELGTDDLLQLRQAGVSDRVVIAMIAAARGRRVETQADGRRATRRDVAQPER